MPWTHGEATLQRVVPALAFRKCRPDEAKRGVQTRSDGRRGRENRPGWIHFHKHWQVRACGCHIAGFQSPVAAELALHADVVMLHNRSCEFPSPADEGDAGWKARGSGDALQGIGELRGGDGEREIHLSERLEWWGERAVLEEVALAGDGVIEESPSGADAGATGAEGVPNGGEARRKIVGIGVVGAPRCARIAGVDEPGRCRRVLGRLLGRMEGRQMVLRFGEGLIHFIAQTECEREPLVEAELVLRVA